MIVADAVRECLPDPRPQDATRVPEMDLPIETTGSSREREGLRSVEGKKRGVVVSRLLLSRITSYRNL